MNILYCGDDNTKYGVLISILSLLKHHSSPLYIYILTINYQNVKPFSAHATTMLDRLVKSKNSKSLVKTIDATQIFTSDLPEKNMGSYFTPCSMLRLYAGRVPDLPKDKILYLDYDVVCRANLKDFYETDLVDIEAAGVLDIYGKNFYHYNFPKTDYMNSGVMLFNLKSVARLVVWSEQYPMQKRWMMLADQAALNKSIKHRKLMPRKYNEQGERPNQIPFCTILATILSFGPSFMSKVKPFDIERVHSVLKITEYDDILNEYQKLKGDL